MRERNGRARAPLFREGEIMKPQEKSGAQEEACESHRKEKDGQHDGADKEHALRSPPHLVHISFPTAKHTGESCATCLQENRSDEHHGKYHLDNQEGFLHTLIANILG